MNVENIKKLIDSFYEGETNPEEELLLQKYFEGNNVAEELLLEKDYFQQLYVPEPIHIPPTLEDKINNLIDNLDKKQKRTKLTFKKVVQWTSIAACVTVLLLAGIYKMNKFQIKGDNNNLTVNNGKQVEKPITEVEYTELKDALHLFSSNFNKGLEQLNEMNNNLEKTSNILNNTFKR